TPQGGIVSPILANIYLNELDKKVKQISLEYNTTKRQRRANNEYKLIADKIYARRKKLKMLTLEEKEALEEKLEKLLQERNEYRLT
ncbi:reverse transcriptase, partial [Alkalibacillus haloalkaliphilus]|nr:reverse transcriptase [Alkalibacillus haloalkaliphilus]